MSDDAFHPFICLDEGPLHYFSVLGRALYTAQHLEMNCRSVLGFISMRDGNKRDGAAFLDNPEFLKGIEKLWKKTLGANVLSLEKIGVFSDDGVSIFRVAVEARNEIAHDVTMGIDGRIDSELDDHIIHILDLVRKIATADLIVSILIQLLNKEPLPLNDFIEGYADKIVDWVAESTFG